MEKVEIKQIFISYAREDKKLAERIFNDLKKSGLCPWLDSKCLLPGQKWKVEIKKAIKNSSYFLALLSSNSVTKRGYVQKELKEALDLLDEFPESDIFIIPVRLDMCEPSYEQLRAIQWVDLFDSYDEGFQKIVHAINSKESEPKSYTFISVISTGQGAFIKKAYRITSQEGEVDSVIGVPKLPRVLTALTNRKLELWDVNSTHRINLFNDDVVYPREWLNDFTISHDGRFVALSWDDGACDVWDLKTGMCHPYHNDPMFSAVVLSGGKKLITTGDEEGVLLIWGLKNDDRAVDKIRVACKELLEKIVLLPDEKHILFASWGNTIGLCNLDSGKIVGRLYGHTGRVKCLSVDLAGRYVVSGSADESIRLWDVLNQDCVCTLGGHNKPIVCVDITPDGHLAVSSDGDTLKLWELTTGECLLSIKAQLSSACFTGNGDQLVIAAGHDLRVYDLKI